MLNNSTKTFLKKHCFLMLILLVGFLMRWQNINQPFIDAFSWRQSSTAMMAENFFTQDWNIFYPQVSWSGPGPSYQGREFQTVSYLAAIGYQLFGQHDYIGRMIVVGFGMWGIYALYQLILLVWDKKHALAGAAMMAIIPGSVFIDRSFLPDPAMVSLTTTSMWLFVLYLYKNKGIYLILAAISGCLGILSKIPGLIIALPMLYALITVYKQRGELIFSRLKPVILAAVLVMIPVIAYYSWATYLSHNYPPYHFAGSGNWVWNDWKEFFSEFYYLRKLKGLLEYWILGYAAIILFVMGLLFYPPKKENGQPTSLPWFFHFLLLGCLFYYIIGAKELVRNPWNFHLFLPVISVFCGRSLIIFFSLNQSPQWMKVFRISLLLIFMLGYHIKILRNNLFTDQWAIDSYRMGKELNALKQPGDLMITTSHNIGDPIAIYYSGSKGWVFPFANNWAPTVLPEEDITSINSLKDMRNQGAVWFGIVNKHYQDILVSHPELAYYLHTQMNLIKKTDDFVIFKW